MPTNLSSVPNAPATGLLDDVEISAVKTAASKPNPGGTPEPQTAPPPKATQARPVPAPEKPTTRLHKAPRKTIEFDVSLKDYEALEALATLRGKPLKVILDAERDAFVAEVYSIVGAYQAEIQALTERFREKLASKPTDPNGSSRSEAAKF